MNKPQLVTSHSAASGPVQFYLPTAQDSEHTPYRMADLATGAQLFIWSIRKWLQIRRFPGKFDSQLFEAHQRIRAPEAAEAIEECMALLSVSALRTVIVECPCQTHLSCDELTLLNVCRALQSGHDEAAEKAIARLIRGRLGRIYCRSARDYGVALAKAGFPLTRITKLKVAEVSP
ncbi:MAG: hypothetical protein ACE37D_16725 [Pseudomonadales bacterium]